MQRTENILALLTLAGIFMIHFDVPGGAILSILVVMVFAAFYMIGGYFVIGRPDRKLGHKGGHRPVLILMNVFFGFSLAQAITGILFTLMDWPGQHTILILGLAATGVMTLFYVALFRNETHLIRKVVVRCAGAFAYSALVLLLASLD